MNDPAVPAVLSFDCPRCHTPADEAFYGPCASCRTELRHTLGNDPRAVERTAFEPAMHVTPNAVAIKE